MYSVALHTSASFETANEAVAHEVLNAMLECLVQMNVALMRSHRFPQLYSTHVRYRQEPLGDENWRGELLEAHDSYELGDGFSMNKRHGVWHVYFRGLHIDLRLKLNPEHESDLTSFPTAVDAFQAVRDRYRDDPRVLAMRRDPEVRNSASP